MSFLIVKKLGGQVQASIHVPTWKTVSQVVIVYEDWYIRCAVQDVTTERPSKFHDESVET